MDVLSSEIADLESAISEKYFGKRVPRREIDIDSYNDVLTNNTDDDLVVRLLNCYDKLLETPMY